MEYMSFYFLLKLMKPKKKDETLPIYEMDVLV